MADNTPLAMRGVIVETMEMGGCVADMTYPARLPGVQLPLDALCLVRDPNGANSRPRISNQHAPNFPVRVGDHVIALASPVREISGRAAYNPISGRDIPEVDIVAVSAVDRWGLLPKTAKAKR